jgi:hypothetical protein
MKQISTFLFLFFISVTRLMAQVPATLSYQGLLTDANGNPVANGTHSVTFNFYTSSSGGTAAFSRGPLSVTTFQGLFTVILGNGGTGNAALPNLGSTQYYVGLRFDTGTSDLTPLVALTAVPYAFTASALDASAKVNASQITGTLAASSIPSGISVPVGTIIAFGGSAIPSGWLICDGSEVSRTAYASLYTAISTSWGIGNNSTTFNLPDLRGNFLRGCNSCQNTASANIALKPLTAGWGDPDAAGRGALYSGATGDKVGSYQGDVFQGHWHYVGSVGNPSGAIQVAATTSYATTSLGVAGGGTTSRMVGGDVTTDNLGNGTPRISSETRPKNAYVMYIIKYQ